MANKECTHIIEKQVEARIEGLCNLCLQKEVEELKKDKSHLEDIESDLNNTIGFLQTGVDMWKEKVERLKKALKKYGRHISCARRHTIVHRKGKWEDGGTEKRWVAAKCDCGLEQALKGKVKDGR